MQSFLSAGPEDWLGSAGSETEQGRPGGTENPLWGEARQTPGASGSNLEQS